MKTTKRLTSKLLHLVLMCLAFVVGASQGVWMAAASDLPDAGVTASGAPQTDPTAGIATETQGREDGDEEFYQKEVDQRITKIRPMSTPIDQISRKASSKKSNSFEIKYYSIGTRPLSCAVVGAHTAMSATSNSMVLTVDDPNIFTLDDTIRVVGVKGICDESGNNYPANDERTPDLMLHVCGKDATSGKPTVYAVNGNKNTANQPILCPALKDGQVLLRMGKACSELDVQTGRFNNLPTAEIQYCQNFMMQIEESTFNKIAKKEVNWDFSDIEEDAIYDMKLAMENSFLFGVKSKIKHPSKNSMDTWFTGGIWWMAGKDIEVGEWNATKGEAVITDDNLVDISKDMFVGTGLGDKRKVIFCGSDMLAAFSKVQSEKFRLKETVERWDLRFKSWVTDFGELYVLHHEMFDLCGMSDCGFALDPEFLEKRTHKSWARNILDLQKAGIRNTDAVVLQEVCGLYLRYPKAHARMRLAKAPTA